MVRKEVIDSLVKSYQKDLQDSGGVTRELRPVLQKRFATVVSGIRRCGKSTLARQLVRGTKVYYFNFENVQLADFGQKDFTKLEQSFKELLGEGGVYLLDEVQNVVGWEVYVRQLVDAGGIVLVTGSNATMLSKELGTRLTGRNLRYELYPFSFREFLTFTGKEASLKTFDEYFTKGGFPEYLRCENADILRNLFQDIFYRDVLVRNDFRSESQLKQFVAFISSNTGVKISNNKLKGILGLGSANTVAQFVHATEQAYLFFSVSLYNHSIAKQQKNPKKIYCVDNGLLQMNSFSFSEKKGRYLENSVFMHLKRNGKDVYYHQGEHECDFVVREGLKVVEAVQVCYELNDDNEQREVQGLAEACSVHNLKKGLLLTRQQEDVIENNGIKISVLPVWKWMSE